MRKSVKSVIAALLSVAMMNAGLFAAGAADLSELRLVYNDARPGFADMASLAGLPDNPAGLEYRASGASSWIAVDAAGLALPIENKPASYVFRYSGQTKTLTVPVRPQKPDVSFDPKDEVSLGLTEDMEVSFDEGVTYRRLVQAGTGAPGDVEIPCPLTGVIDALPTGEMNILVRTAATAGTAASYERVIILAARRDAPANIVYDSRKNVITGLYQQLEYKRSADSDWTRVKASSLSLEGLLSDSADTVFQFRRYGTNSLAVNSEIFELTVQQTGGVPSLTLDIINELITGFDPVKTYEFSVNGSVWWPVPVSGGSFAISEYIAPTRAGIIQIREVTQNGAPPGAYQEITVNPRDAAPAAVGIDYSGVNPALTGVDSTMEYKYAGADFWTPVTGTSVTLDYPIRDIYVYVRKRADQAAETPYSQEARVLLKAPPGMPYITFKAFNETLVGMKEGYRVSVGGGNFETVTAGMLPYSVTDIIDAVPYNQRSEVRICSVTPDGQTAQDRYFWFSSRPEAPAVLYNREKNVLDGMNSLMQYRVKGTADWKSGHTSLNVINLLSPDIDVVLEIRFIGRDELTPASKIQEVTLSKLAAPPVGAVTLDLEKEALVGLQSGQEYQYSLNGISWYNAGLDGLTFPVGKFIATDRATSLYFREKGPGTAMLFNLPKRSMKPTAVRIIYNDPDYPDKAVLVGVTSNMEYRIRPDTVWTQATGNKVALGVPDAKKFVYVRVRGSGATFSPSEALSIGLYSPGATSGISYKSDREAVRVSPQKHEMLDGGVYVPVFTEEIYCSAIIDGIAQGGTLELTFRNAATETAPAGKPYKVTLYPRHPDLVSGSVVCDRVKGSIKKERGVGSLQYSINGGDWTSVAPTPSKIKSAVSLSVRLKATSNFSAGNPMVLF